MPFGPGLQPGEPPLLNRPTVTVPGRDCGLVVDPVTDVARWSRRRDSNPEPAVYKTAALPIELRRRDGQGHTADDPFRRRGDDRAGRRRRVKRAARRRRVTAWPWRAVVGGVDGWSAGEQVGRSRSSAVGVGRCALRGLAAFAGSPAAGLRARRLAARGLAAVGLPSVRLGVAASARRPRGRAFGPGGLAASASAAPAVPATADVGAAASPWRGRSADGASVSASMPSSDRRASAGSPTRARGSGGPAPRVALGERLEQEDRPGDGGVERPDRAPHRDAHEAGRSADGRPGPGPAPRCRRRSRAARAGRVWRAVSGASPSAPATRRPRPCRSVRAPAGRRPGTAAGARRPRPRP